MNNKTTIYNVVVEVFPNDRARERLVTEQRQSSSTRTTFLNTGRTHTASHEVQLLPILEHPHSLPPPTSTSTQHHHRQQLYLPHILTTQQL